MRGWRGLDGVEGRGAEGRERKGRRQALRLAPSCCCSFISPASSAPSMVRIPRVYHWLAIAAPTPCTLHSCCTTCIRSLLSIVASRLSLGAQRSRTGAFARAARRRGPVTWAGPHGRAAACQWGSTARPACAAQPGAWIVRPPKAKGVSCGTSRRPYQQAASARPCL